MSKIFNISQLALLCHTCDPIHKPNASISTNKKATNFTRNILKNVFLLMIYGNVQENGRKKPKAIGKIANATNDLHLMFNIHFGNFRKILACLIANYPRYFVQIVLLQNVVLGAQNVFGFMNGATECMLIPTISVIWTVRFDLIWKPNSLTVTIHLL